MLSQDVKEPFIFVDNSTQKVLAIYIVHPDKPYEIKKFLIKGEIIL